MLGILQQHVEQLHDFLLCCGVRDGDQELFVQV